MTDNNTNDPIPDGENLGSAGSPHSTERDLHQRSASFDQTGESSFSRCRVCGTSIPPTHDRCPDHQTDPTDTKTSNQSDWSISNVGMVLVSASGKFSALAKATVALRRRENSDGGKNSFDLIYDFGDPSDTLTSQWGGELPDATELNTTIGKHLYEHALSKTSQNQKTTEYAGNLDIDPTILGTPSNSEHYLYTEHGTAITNKEQITALEDSPNNPDHEFWIVPALLYKSTSKDKDQSHQLKTCVNCGPEQHVFDGYENPPQDSESEKVEVWRCTSCNSRNAHSTT